MKKTYKQPNLKVVKLKINSSLLSYSNTEAASDATVFGRESSFEDEE